MNTKLCPKCKQEKLLTSFSKQKNAASKYQAYCKTCYADNLRQWRKKNPHKSAEHALQYRKDNPEKIKISNAKNMRRPKSRWCQLVWAAKKRNYAVDITYEQYLTIISNSCYYCDGELPEQGGGVDRVDNSKGYTLDNCVPCCTRCNHIFFDYDKTETFKHMQKMLLKFKP